MIVWNIHCIVVRYNWMLAMECIHFSLNYTNNINTNRNFQFIIVLKLEANRWHAYQCLCALQLSKCFAVSTELTILDDIFESSV